ncbi:MAG: 30S ribosome-binding factor RbfA [Christensenellaceae bacterium]|jgi:ribosome-binding factor A
MAKNRMARIEEELKRALAGIIRTEVKDDRLSEIVGVTKVDVTNDLKYAKIYTSVFDTEKKRGSSIDALNHAASFIRTKLAHSVDIRRVPELTFILDDSVEYGIKISQLLEGEKRKGEQ